MSLAGWGTRFWRSLFCRGLGKKIFNGSKKGALIGFAVGAILSVLPTEFSPQYYTHAFLGDLSLASFMLLMAGLLHVVYEKELFTGRDFTLFSALCVLCGVAILPCSLGLPWPDFYRAGFSNHLLPIFWGIIALVTCLKRFPQTCRWILFSLVFFIAGWFRSANLWHSLIDTPAFLACLIWLTTKTVRGRHKRVASKQGVGSV